MDLPATHYGTVDRRNPVVSVFEREVKTFLSLMRRATSAGSPDNSLYAKGIRTLVEIWRNYRHRLPSQMYEERMLQAADALFEMELYEVALWQGYALHLLQFSPLKITQITDADHLMASFFPEGLDADQDSFTLKALEFLLWASVSLELSVPIMTPEYLPWIATLYCAVCRCYYDNRAAAKAEVQCPRLTTERTLMSLFDSGAAYFLGILEALWDVGWGPLQNKMPDDPDQQEVVMELLTAGMRVLSGENKVSVPSALRFIKLLFQYKQSEAFSRLTKEMLQVLSEIRPDEDVVLDVVLFLWNKAKLVVQGDEIQNPTFTYSTEKIDHFEKFCGVTLLQWLWCLYELCEVASVCGLANMDCMIAAEMTYTLAALLERAAESRHHTPITESELLGRIKKNKVSKALFLIQKALLVYETTTDSSNQTKSLLEEASSLIDKATLEERKVYLANTFRDAAENEDSQMKENKDNPPPAPILLSRTDTSLTFAPAPYNLEGQVPALHGECFLKVEGLEPNQKYVFAVAAYNSQGNIVGNSLWSVYDDDFDEEEQESGLHFSAALDDSTQTDGGNATEAKNTAPPDTAVLKGFAAQLPHVEGRRQVKFNLALEDSGNIQSSDLDEDFSKPGAVYKLPVSPEHMSSVTDAYSASIKYLEDNGENYLRVVALHEMGNLQYYNGNTRYALTSDINQRTKYCLLSAHLFKCVLCCSTAQPQADLQYAHHSIGEELLPGTDLFSEPHRVHLGTTVTSLKFLCHWLFTKGFYVTVLPHTHTHTHTHTQTHPVVSQVGPQHAGRKVSKLTPVIPASACARTLPASGWDCVQRCATHCRGQNTKGQ
ncbi:unnamed protein product [Tetraodon nigroviridis]|uniref:(spotted green pufferfish) hypothetical protein n=1 Tax=Tetraodon nigroviridis TaxID=99883 RepID=Q4SFR2_TETNG|nr:unnamed protein product [Tetraodon nigroviridis]